MKKIIFVLAIIFTTLSFSQEKQWGLEECVNYAIENNISVKQSELDTELALENIRTAKGNFLPGVNASASQNFNFGSYIDQNGGRVASDSRGNSFGINTGINIFNGFQNTNTYKQSKLGLESSKLQLAILKDNISLNVVNSYLNVLFNKESLRISDDKIKVTKQQLTQIQKLVDAGVRAVADLSEIRAQLATDQQSYVNAENSIDLALLSLAQLLQVSHVGFEIQNIELDITSVSLLYNNTEDIFNIASEDRPEIKNAQLSIDDAEYSIEIAKGAYMPTLSASASAGTSYQHAQGQKDVRTIVDVTSSSGFSTISNGFGTQLEDNLGYSVGLSLNIPIFNRNQSKARVNSAKINAEKSKTRLIQAKQDLRVNIETAYADAKATLKQFEAAQLSVIAQEEAFKNAKDRYDLGVMTSFEFEQVRSRFVAAQSSLINAKYNFVFKSKVLDFYAGKSLL
ncbi:MAG: TolC family protein [Flavobacteriaceae bacterium]|nr:TolC family protein [Flavobacteriaceae bacterium]